MEGSYQILILYIMSLYAMKLYIDFRQDSPHFFLNAPNLIMFTFNFSNYFTLITYRKRGLFRFVHIKDGRI